MVKWYKATSNKFKGWFVRWSDSIMEKLVNSLDERWDFSLRPSQSRWQSIILLVTIDFLFFTIALAFFGIQISIKGNMQMTVWLVFLIVFAILGVIGLVFTFCLGSYLLRHQKPDPIQTSIKTMKKELTAELKNIGQLLEEYNKKPDKINEKIDKDKSKD